ncbi:MAG: DUF2238 domain-containing protein [Gammaproteobacteria bacterium]
MVALLVWYASFSIAMAIAPADREFWMAASILPVLLVAGLVVSYRAFPLSSISYFLITLFLTLHAIGVHYTYGAIRKLVAAGARFRPQPLRSHCPFLFRVPIDLSGVVSLIRGWLRYYLPNITILGLSGLWEIVESWFAQVMHPDLGLVFLGFVFAAATIVGMSGFLRSPRIMGSTDG